MTFVGNSRAYWRAPEENRLKDGWDDYSEGAYGYGGYRRDRDLDPKESLEPLISQLRQYDQVREKMEQATWGQEDIGRLNRALTAPFVIVDGWGRPSQCSLVDQKAIQSALFNLDGHFGIHLQVRNNKFQMPLFYLCKMKRSWRCESGGVVLEDFYRSPGYPLHDDRFVPLLVYSRERCYVRLSRFREKYLNVLGNEEEKTDRLLAEIGASVFEYAWDLYQQIGCLLSVHFGLKHFFSALEALYLVLSADLSELRNSVTPEMELFFKQVYTGSAIPKVLERIEDMDGEKLELLARKARELYPHLLQAFGKYLETPVCFKWRAGKIAFYKLAFSNINSLENASKLLKNEKNLKGASQRLEVASKAIVEELLGQ